MFCTNCGQKSESKDSAFCSNCGTKIDEKTQQSPSNEITTKQPSKNISPKNMIFIGIAVIAAVTLLFVLFNSGGNSGDLVGTWDINGDYRTLIIRADGTATIQKHNTTTGVRNILPEEYKWETSGSKLIMRDNTTDPYMQKNTDKNYTYKIKGNTLTLQQKANGQVYTENYTKK